MAQLRKDFVNAWVLARDLPELGTDVGEGDLGKLEKILRENYSYPVDSLLISPELDVLAQLSFNELLEQGLVGYEGFLAKGKR